MAGAGSLLGTRLGVYEVQALVGAGGMGEVYRARDTRLQRDVAVKILPDTFANDPDRVMRFEREARLLAALNHPNIAAIYGVEERGGQSVALVLELVEGDTLAERLSGGALPVATAVGFGRQIAIGLDAAHEKSIIHRDLKPANIKVTPEGIVKILDFGIAKAVNVDAHIATTIASDNTRAGVVIGTAAYMSPEQARGLTVDKRTDIWAFGCVLFEMLSGRSPFAGHTTSDTIAATLEREPPWSELPASVPARIRGLLQRCLEKDPRRRLRDIGDVILELDDRPAARDARSHRRGYLIGAAIAAAAAVAVAAWLFLPLDQWLRADPPESRIVIDIALDSPHVAFSPDGASLVIQARFDPPEQLILRKLGSTDQRSLPGTEGAMFPFWSPDGRSIAFFADRKLKRIDLVGDTVQEIADAPIGRGGAWTADGSILFAPSARGPLYRVAANGGMPVAFTTLGPGQNDHRAPVILPGGHHFIFYARGSATARGVYVGNIDGSEPRRLLDAAAAAVYAPSGHLLFARENQLLAQRFDAATLTLNGEPFKVADNVGVNRGVSLATLAASSAGAIAYATAAATRLQFAWFDRSGAEVGRVGTPDSSPVTNPALSPDGRTLAFARLMEGNWDIWLMELARGVMTRLTSEPNLDFFPVWMTDNTHIVYQSVRGVEPDLYRRAIGSKAELLIKTPGGKMPMDVSRDGRFLLFGSATSETNTDIWMMPLDGSVPPQPLVETRFVEGGAQFSPDGRWFAYSSNETGQSEIYVRPLTGSGPPRRVSTAGGNLARWSHAGKELFYLAPDGKLMRTTMTGLASRGPSELSIGPPEALFTTPIDPSGFSTRSPYVVSIDDRRFLMPIAIDKPKPATLVVVLNWHPQP